jgi:hypothetical protein
MWINFWLDIYPLLCHLSDNMRSLVLAAWFAPLTCNCLQVLSFSLPSHCLHKLRVIRPPDYWKRICNHWSSKYLPVQVYLSDPQWKPSINPMDLHHLDLGNDVSQTGPTMREIQSLPSGPKGAVILSGVIDQKVSQSLDMQAVVGMILDMVGLLLPGKHNILLPLQIEIWKVVTV